jgi:hypothetical protein
MPFYHDYLKIGQIFRLVGDQKDAIKANDHKSFLREN